MSEEKAKKPKRVRRAQPVSDKSLTKSQVTIVAGRVQSRVDAIVRNHDKSIITATSRLDEKYKKLVQEELVGLDFQVVALLELPEFAAEKLVDEYEPDVVVEEEAAQ